MKILLRTTNVFVESLSYRMVNIESNDDEDEDDDNLIIMVIMLIMIMIMR